MILKHRLPTKILSGGKEIQGAVIKQGKMEKTVTVRAWWKTFNFRYYRYRKRGRNYQAHDEENFCRVGDVVVIKQCEKLSPIKHYYVRNVLKQAARFDYWDHLPKESVKMSLDKFYGTLSKEQIDYTKVSSDEELEALVQASGREEEFFSMRATQKSIRNIQATEGDSASK